MEERYDKLLEDPAFWNKLLECETPLDVKNLFAQNDVTLKDKTADEWIDFIEEHRTEMAMTLDQLGSVAGGALFPKKVRPVLEE